MTIEIDSSTREARPAGPSARRRRKGRIEIAIAPLAYPDLPKVMAIERRSFPAPWSLAMFVLELSKPSSICLGARYKRNLIGYLVCSRYHTVWHVMNIAVDGRHRRKRVATALIEHLFAETDQGDERYTLEVRVSNAEAIEMYESFGFRSAGIRRRYYHDNNEDALIMWRTHPGSAPEAVAAEGTRS
jgi:[ribosomal protein S18]-alanine N-acetyltransferase